MQYGNRRPTARFALALAFAALLLPAFPAEPAHRDELVIGMSLEPPHLDPTAGAAAAIDEVVYANVFEGLVRIDRNGDVRPGLAESWTISDDGLTYTFYLRDGVRFHDGIAFDSADVMFTLNRARAENSTNAQKGFFEPIAEVLAPDPLSVIVKLKRPTGQFLFNMGSGDAVIVAAESAATNKTRPVGTGPFRFERWAKGDRVVLKRHGDDRDSDAVRLNKVVFKFISDPSAQVAALLAGDVDAFPNLGSPENLERFRADPRFRVVVGTTEGETILAINNMRPPFSDRRVRRAACHALDRQAVVDGAMYGYGTLIGSHFAPHHPAYVDLTELCTHDVAKAKALLKDAGHPDGFSVTLKLPPPSYARRGGEIVAAQLAAVGIKVAIEPMEWAQWLEQVFRGHDFDLTIVSHTEPLDIDIYARDDYYFGYRNPEFQVLVQNLNATVDPDKRNALFRQAQRIIAEDAVNGFLFQLAKHGVWRADLVGLWENSPVQANDVTGVHWK